MPDDTKQDPAHAMSKIRVAIDIGRSASGIEVRNNDCHTSEEPDRADEKRGQSERPLASGYGQGDSDHGNQESDFLFGRHGKQSRDPEADNRSAMGEIERPHEEAGAEYNGVEVVKHRVLN